MWLARPTVAILAAGRGSRLSEKSGLPKPCLSFLGRSIAEWSLRAFATAGLEEFLVVVGSRAEHVRDHYRRLARQLGLRTEFIEVGGWQRGNGVSALAAARSLRRGPYILTMADHLFSAGLIGTVLATPPRDGELCLAVDRDPGSHTDLQDLMKVRIRERRVVAIGKDLGRWNAGDTGLFYCSGVLETGLERAQRQGGFSLADGVRDCSRAGTVRAIEITSRKSGPKRRP